MIKKLKVPLKLNSKKTAFAMENSLALFHGELVDHNNPVFMPGFDLPRTGLEPVSSINCSLIGANGNGNDDVTHKINNFMLIAQLLTRYVGNVFVYWVFSKYST